MVDLKIKTILLILGTLAMQVACAQEFIPLPRSGHIEFGDWEFNWTVGNNHEGLELKRVYWKGTKLLHKASLPVIRVKYRDDGDWFGEELFRAGCGPYNDRIHWGELIVPRGTSSKVVGRNWDNQVLEIAVFAQIGSYDIYQAYYFDRSGEIELRTYSRGWSCKITHRHHPYWRLDFDIDYSSNALREIFHNGTTFAEREYNSERNFYDYDSDEGVVSYIQVLNNDDKRVTVYNELSDPRDARPPVSPWHSFSDNDGGVRVFRSSEDVGWKWLNITIGGITAPWVPSPYTDLGLKNPRERVSRDPNNGTDVVIWLTQHLDHAWIDNDDEEGREWHWTIGRIFPRW